MYKISVSETANHHIIFIYILKKEIAVLKDILKHFYRIKLIKTILFLVYHWAAQ